MQYIFGHKNPDTDAILSSMIYQKLDTLTGGDSTAIRLGECNNETTFCLQKLGWIAPDLMTSLPSGTEVVLTDHNEASQSLDNFGEVQIKGIIDHHRCTITTNEPITIIILPVASTCSILYKMRKETGKEIPRDVAVAMLMGILSDTLFFRSPTTTTYDKTITGELLSLSGIETMDKLEALSLEMFTAKSDLGDIDARKLVMMDYKAFETNGKKFGIGTIETTNPGYALGRKDEIVTELTKIKEEQGLDLVFASIVDILEEKNICIGADNSDNTLLSQIFASQIDSGSVDLHNRISRKKQITPQITEYFSQQ